MDEESFSSKTWEIDFLKKEKLFKPGLQGLFLYIQFPPWCKDKDYIGLWIMDYGLWIMDINVTNLRKLHKKHIKKPKHNQ